MTVPKPSILSRRNRKAIFLFVASGVYAALLVLALLQLAQGRLALGLMGLYILGAAGMVGLFQLNRSYSDATRSRRILTEVLDKSTEAHIITGAGGETLYANTAFSTLTGHAGARATLDDLFSLFPSADGARQLFDSLAARATPGGIAVTETHITPEGRNIWLQITCQSISGENIKHDYIHWRIDDITQRHEMESAIREEREKLRDFTDNAPVGFFAVDGDGKFRFANETLLRLLGTDRATLIGRARLQDFLVDPPANGQPYDCFSSGGMHQHGEVAMKGAGGRVFKAAITHSITRDEQGQVISRSVVYDLTSEEQMQRALLESEDRFERLFDEAPVGICLLSKDGIVSETNRNLAAMLGLTPDIINGKPLLNFLHKDNHNRFEEWLRVLARGDRAAAAIEITLKGAGEVVAQLYARKFASSTDFVLHFIDLTDQKKLEKQFTQSQKMQAVGQLAGGIAHDFNNLLTAMIGFCDLLILRHKPGDPSFADIMQIKHNANRAANLVRQLLAFSRQQTLQPRVLDLTDVLTELSHLIRRLIGVNIELNLHHANDVGLIKADQGQMEQVLVNLVVNARDAMPQGGKLNIRTQNLSNEKPLRLGGDDILPAGEWVKLIVEDSGTGIPPDVLPRIFEPFFSTKDVGAGTGLGLATVHGIIHQTGGFITVDSHMGRGTAFTIYLPRHYATASDKKIEAADEKAGASDLTGSASILLVEDEDAVRTFSARALSNKGYKVMDAPGGDVALRLLEDGKIMPEILITDVMMPEMDGTTLAKHVREKYPQVKIIFISGYAEDRFKEHLGAGVWFLPKPFTLKQLATKVKEVIDHKE